MKAGFTALRLRSRAALPSVSGKQYYGTARREFTPGRRQTATQSTSAARYNLLRMTYVRAVDIIFYFLLKKV